MENNTLLDRLKNVKFPTWEEIKAEENKKKREEQERIHKEYIDNFCEYRHFNENLSELDIEATLKKIAEELWKFKQILNNKADREIRLGGY